jgi:hypothetical protein
MRVFADAARRLRGGELVGAGVIEEQKRIEPVSLLVGKKTPNGKPVAHPMLGNIPDNPLDGFHRNLLEIIVGETSNFASD